MNIITIEDHHGQLVVDSRLIAEELDIQHKNFLETIGKYLDVIQHAFGSVAFETRLVKRPQGGTYEEKWAWLNEDQSLLVMSFSRNTPPVVKCKVALVKGFSEAKRKLENLRSQTQPQPQTPPSPPQPQPLPGNLMSADLTSDDEYYQQLKAIACDELKWKYRYRG